MKKILVISYFFPPCNLTAAERIGSWEKYFYEFGYYPIVITRNWTGNEINQSDRLKKSGNKKKTVTSERSQIHYLPYESSWRDYFFIRSDKNIFFKLISKFFTSVMFFLQNFTIKVIPFRNIYFEADSILEKDNSIDYMIISGNPFEQFYFGYKLKAKYPHLKWIADYRDEWTTSEITDFNWFKQYLWNFQRKSELRWVEKADLITTNTNYAVKKLSKLHNKQAKLLINGYEFEKEKNGLFINGPQKLIIVHNGTLYPTQDLSLFAEGLKKVKVPTDFKIELFFPGIKIIPDVAKKVDELLSNCPVEYQLSDRISKEDVLNLQQSADALLMVAHKGKKGIVGSKLYEYIGLEKNILLCPSDDDEIQETLERTNLGFIAKSPDDVKIIIEDWIKNKLQGKSIQKKANPTVRDGYERKSQVKVLAKYLNNIE